MKQITLYIKIFTVWTLIGSISKIAFLGMYHSQMKYAGLQDMLQVVVRGLRLDISIAGYLSILPAVLLMVSIWNTSKPFRWIWNVYFAFISFICSLAYVSNLCLYAYWGFPLDNTPILYVKTSPSAAFASMSTWQIIFVPILIIAVSSAIFFVFWKISHTLFITSISQRKHRSWSFCGLLILLTLSVIPIRGGLSTGTNHTGSVYFSGNMVLNHAAVNPIFCFIESVSHMENTATRYRFMSKGKANSIFNSLTYTSLRTDAEKHEYNVILICLESFSRYIMTENGHVKGVTPNMDKIAREGIFFTNFYANSFRTDRGIVSVLSGFPAQPCMSIMDIPHKSTSLPSIAHSLDRNGYKTCFYYGGDINYSNMLSYIVGTGYRKTVSEKDFPYKLRTGKWGVHDETLFKRVLSDVKKYSDKAPFFKTVLSGSSHEPWEVPFSSKLKSPRLNAFAYTDHCLGEFIENLKKTKIWNNTLVVITPDHLGCYPVIVDNYALWRYSIPLIITGGAIDKSRKIETVGGQIDIPATLLGMLGIDHSDFLYSKDIFDPKAPHFAFFTFPDVMGMATKSSYVVYDNTFNKIINADGPDRDKLLVEDKAFLQKLYDDIDKR